MDINIFTQVGFVVLVGLASKNAILIVEFAKQQRESGVSAREATLNACRLRLRPIIMTSLAFILGVVPLDDVARSRGRDAAHLGTAVFSGMLGVTLFGIFLTPVFFYVIDRLGDRGCSPSRLVIGDLARSSGFVASLGGSGLAPARASGRRFRHMSRLHASKRHHGAARGMISVQHARLVKKPGEPPHRWHSRRKD